MILKQSNKDSGFSSNCCNLNVRTCSKSLKSLCQSKCLHFKLTIFGLATNFDSNCYQLVTKLNRMDPRQWLAGQRFWCSQEQISNFTKTRGRTYKIGWKMYSTWNRSSMTRQTRALRIEMVWRGPTWWLSQGTMMLGLAMRKIPIFHSILYQC